MAKCDHLFFRAARAPVHSSVLSTPVFVFRSRQTRAGGLQGECRPLFCRCGGYAGKVFLTIIAQHVIHQVDRGGTEVHSLANTLGIHLGVIGMAFTLVLSEWRSP